MVSNLSLHELMTDRDRDSNSGKFSEKVSDKDILNAVADLQPASTAEIGETVGLSRSGVYLRLVELENQELVSRKTIGRTAAWFRM